MKKKLWKGIILGLASLCLFTGCGKNSGPSARAPTPEKPVELRMNVTTADSSVWMACAREFKKQIEAKTGGRYKVAIYSNEQLSSGNQIKGVEMLLDGTINEPVAIGHTVIWPGDIIVGDQDGLTVIPPLKAESILEKALAIDAHEAQVMATMDKDRTWDRPFVEKKLQELHCEYL